MTRKQVVVAEVFTSDVVCRKNLEIAGNLLVKGQSYSHANSQQPILKLDDAPDKVSGIHAGSATFFGSSAKGPVIQDTLGRAVSVPSGGIVLSPTETLTAQEWSSLKSRVEDKAVLLDSVESTARDAMQACTASFGKLETLESEMETLHERADNIVLKSIERDEHISELLAKSQADLATKIALWDVSLSERIKTCKDSLDLKIDKKTSETVKETRVEIGKLTDRLDAGLAESAELFSAKTHDLEERVKALVNENKSKLEGRCDSIQERTQTNSDQISNFGDRLNQESSRFEAELKTLDSWVKSKQLEMQDQITDQGVDCIHRSQEGFDSLSSEIGNVRSDLGQQVDVLQEACDLSFSEMQQKCEKSEEAASKVREDLDDAIGRIDGVAEDLKVGMDQTRGLLAEAQESCDAKFKDLGSQIAKTRENFSCLKSDLVKVEENMVDRHDSLNADLQRSLNKVKNDCFLAVDQHTLANQANQEQNDGRHSLILKKLDALMQAQENHASALHQLREECDQRIKQVEMQAVRQADEFAGEIDKITNKVSHLKIEDLENVHVGSSGEEDQEQNQRQKQKENEGSSGSDGIILVKQLNHWVIGRPTIETIVKDLWDRVGKLGDRMKLFEAIKMGQC